jgi:aminoglycoside 6'-N-acetyltransferase
MPSFAFRRLAAADLPLVARWLHLPHVRAAFGEPREWLDEIGANQDADWVRHYLADHRGAPAGFAQHYDTSRAPRGPWSAQPPGTAGLDFLLGEPALLGRGLGRALVREFADFAAAATGATRLILDPNPANRASVRCAEAAGFRQDPGSGFWIREPAGTARASPV